MNEESNASQPPSVAAEDIRRGIERAVARMCPRWLHADREDLVQSSMVRILERARDGGSSEFNATYLWKTAYTVVLDEVRRVRWKYERTLTDDVPASRAPETDDPQRQALSREFVRAVRGCLLGLADDRRRAVQLRLAGMSYSDVARSLGADDKRAANLVFRGFEDLRACLRGKGAV